MPVTTQRGVSGAFRPVVEPQLEPGPQGWMRLSDNQSIYMPRPLR